MSKERDTAIERARKLQALAEDQPESPEGQTAGAMLKRLRGKWSIKDEELRAVEVQRTLLDRGDSAPWRAFLMALCAETCGGGSLHHKQHSTIYGTKEVAEHTQTLYDYLLDFILKGFRDYRTQRPAPGALWFVQPTGSENDWAMTSLSVLKHRLQMTSTQPPEMPEAPPSGASGAEASEAKALTTQNTLTAREAEKQARNGATEEWQPDRWRLIHDAAVAATRVRLTPPDQNPRLSQTENDAPPPDRSPDASQSAPG